VTTAMEGGKKKTARELLKFCRSQENGGWNVPRPAKKVGSVSLPGDVGGEGFSGQKKKAPDFPQVAGNLGLKIEDTWKGTGEAVLTEKNGRVSSRN